MTDDDLIKRLRGAPADTRGNKNLCLDAADRIEALVRERDEALNQLDSARHSVDVLEGRVAMFMARLAKAVEVLRFYAEVSNYYDGVVGKTYEAPMWSESDITQFELDNGETARAVLAEIGGEE